MNLGITITSTVLVLLVVTPVVLMQQQQKKKERKLLKALKALANQNNCTLTEYDVFNNFAIGIDKNNLFFYKNGTSKQTTQHIDLNEIKSCGVSNSRKPTPNNALGNIVKLELVLNPIKNINDKHTIEIYNHTEDFQLNGELEIIHKWEHIIHSNIS